MTAPEQAELDDYVGRLVTRFGSLANRQGSEAFDNFVSASQYLPAYQWFLSSVPTGAKVLDWGCGNGHFSDFLFERKYEVTPYGFDDPDFLIHVGSPAARRFVQATANVSLPFPDESFDVVTSIGVLEHVREFQGTEIGSLKEIARVLRPNGRFFCFHLPNRYSWIELTSTLIGKWHHRYRFGKKDIERLCSAADLEMTECRRYGFLPRNILRRLPFHSLAMVKTSSNVFESADDSLENVLAPIAQNWMFSVQKRRHD